MKWPDHPLPESVVELQRVYNRAQSQVLDSFVWFGVTRDWWYVLAEYDEAREAFWQDLGRPEGA